MKVVDGQRSYLDATVQDVGRFYDAKVQAHGERWASAPAEVLAGYLRWASHGARILDAGCGTGHLLAYWQERGGHGIGLDCSWASAQLTHRRGIPVVAGSMHQLPFGDRAFEVTYALGSAEHTPDVVESIRELLRVTRRWLVLLLPLWYVDRDGPVSRHYAEETLPNIERWWTVEEWRALLARAGAVLGIEQVMFGGTDWLAVVDVPRSHWA